MQRTANEADPAATIDRRPACDTRKPARHAIDRIYAAAKQEFTRNGVADTHMSEIAARAGVTKQLIYYYFASKEDLLDAVSANEIRANVNAILELDYNDLLPPDALRRFFNDLFRQSLQPSFGHVSFTERTHQPSPSHGTRKLLASMIPKIIGKVSGILARGEQDGSFQREVDAGRFVATALALIYGGFVTEGLISASLGVDMQSGALRSEWVERSTQLLLTTLSPLATPHLYRTVPVHN